MGFLYVVAVGKAELECFVAASQRRAEEIVESVLTRAEDIIVYVVQEGKDYKNESVGMLAWNHASGRLELRWMRGWLVASDRS